MRGEGGRGWGAGGAAGTRGAGPRQPPGRDGPRGAPGRQEQARAVGAGSAPRCASAPAPLASRARLPSAHGSSNRRSAEAQAPSRCGVCRVAGSWSLLEAPQGAGCGTPAPPALRPRDTDAPCALPRAGAPTAAPGWHRAEDGRCQGGPSAAAFQGWPAHGRVPAGFCPLLRGEGALLRTGGGSQLPAEGSRADPVAQGFGWSLTPRLSAKAPAPPALPGDVAACGDGAGGREGWDAPRTCSLLSVPFAVKAESSSRGDEEGSPARPACRSLRAVQAPAPGPGTRPPDIPVLIQKRTRAH